MKISDALQDNVAVIRLSGKLMGGDDATLFHGKIHEYLATKKKNIVVDLKDVSWSNSLGIGMLVAALTAVRREEGRIVLSNITNVRNILAITQMVKVFECFDSLEEAISDLKPEVGVR